MPATFSEGDAAQLVGMCAASKRADGDPLRVLQLGVSISVMKTQKYRFISELVLLRENKYSKAGS